MTEKQQRDVKAELLGVLRKQVQEEADAIADIEERVVELNDLKARRRTKIARLNQQINKLMTDAKEAR